jgi:antitoxin (DNA-binding transcriptional repressor) of toxin-antitoxin stability system
MKAVGIKVLKDNLSKYLALVSAGETILVTDRDEVIAEIRKPERLLPPTVTRWKVFLNQEEHRGAVRPATPGPIPPIEDLRRIPRPRTRVNLQELLDQVRAD